MFQSSTTVADFYAPNGVCYWAYARNITSRDDPPRKLTPLDDLGQYYKTFHPKSHHFYPLYMKNIIISEFETNDPVVLKIRSVACTVFQSTSCEYTSLLELLLGNILKSLAGM